MKRGVEILESALHGIVGEVAKSKSRQGGCQASTVERRAPCMTPLGRRLP
jgi:hypothetical protein